MQTLKRDIYQDVTNRIISALEEGVPPWRCPWDRSQDDMIPINQATGHYYKGINVLLLWLTQSFNGYRTSRWMTYKQAAEKGGQVKKNEHGTLLIFYKPMEKKTGEFDLDGNEVVERYPVIRSFSVFNLDQIDGIELEEPAPRVAFEPLAAAEAVLLSSGVRIHHGGSRAFYRPSTDEITLPEKSRFHSAYDYFATAMHELVHSTGHASRCDRKPYSSKESKGAYAYEELVAEIGSALCMAALGLSGDVQDHASYIDAWLAVLKEDKRAIFKAAAEAQKAHEWLAAKSGATVEYPQAA